MATRAPKVPRVAVVQQGNPYWGGAVQRPAPPSDTSHPYVGPIRELFSKGYLALRQLGLTPSKQAIHTVAGVYLGTVTGFAIGGIPGKWYTRFGVQLLVGAAGKGISSSVDGTAGAFGTGLAIGSGAAFAWDTVGPLVRGYAAVESFVLDAGAAIAGAPGAAAGAIYKGLSTPYLGLPIVGF